MTKRKNKVVGVGIIGVGYWGPNLLRNFLKIDKVKIIYVCDISNENLNKIHTDHPLLKLTTNYSDILSDKDLDLVVISTPISTHFKIAREALLASKHVLIEKPITRTSKEAKELIKIANKKGVKIFSGHTFVYSQAVQKIKEIISKKELGEIYYYDSTRINLGLIQADSNVIWDLAPHDLSILSYILPMKPLTVTAFGKSFVNKKNEEIAHIFITYEKGITAHIHLSWLSPVKVRNILIGGSKKMISYNDIEPSEKIRIYDKGVSIPPSEITPFAPAYRSGDIVIPRLEQTETLFSELNHFIDCIREDKNPITGGVEGLKVVILLEAIEKALKTKSIVHLKSL